MTRSSGLPPPLRKAKLVTADGQPSPQPGATVNTLPLPRRGLTLLEAAVYVRVSPNRFTALMDEGRMPQPRIIGGKRVWDVVELDIYFEAMPRDERTLKQRQPARRPGQRPPA